MPGPPRRAQLRVGRDFLRDPVGTLDALQAAYGSNIGLGVWPLRVAIIGDPTLLGQLFSLPDSSFRWRHPFRLLLFVVGETSLVVSDGDDHRERRASLQAAFSRRRLNGWIPMIAERTDVAVEGLLTSAEHDPVQDLYAVVRSLVLEIAINAFFGRRLASRAEDIGRLFERPQAYLESSGFRQLPHRFPFTRRARVRSDRRALDAIIDAEIAAVRRQPSHDPLDVLEALVLSGSLSDQEIRDQAITLIGAGYNTTAATLSWMLWRATLAPGIWGALGAEADAAFGDTALDGAYARIDHSTLNGLGLADRVMRESLRLHPPGAVSPRIAAEDISLGGHRIAAGTYVLWSSYLAGRDPSVWSRPTEFDPDRFLKPLTGTQAIESMAWVPFGGGTRNCIGFALAQMELTLILARVAQFVDLEPTSGEVPLASGTVVNRPAGGVRMRVSRRRRRT